MHSTLARIAPAALQHCAAAHHASPSPPASNVAGSWIPSAACSSGGDRSGARRKQERPRTRSGSSTTKRQNDARCWCQTCSAVIFAAGPGRAKNVVSLATLAQPSPALWRPSCSICNHTTPIARASAGFAVQESRLWRARLTARSPSSCQTSREIPARYTVMTV